MKLATHTWVATQEQNVSASTGEVFEITLIFSCEIPEFFWLAARR
jgi:hypothetical protein